MNIVARKRRRLAASAIVEVLPTLSGIEVTGITDVSATISGFITANSYSADVKVEYGATASLGSEMVPDNSPFAPSEDAVAFSVELSGLMPDSAVFYRIVVTTSEGPVATEIYSFNTLEPVELTDGNWAAMYEFDGEHNVIPSANLISQLRDNSQGNLEGDEIVINGEFNDTSKWALNGAATISGGKCNINTSGFGSFWNRDLSSYANRVFNFRFTIDSIAVGNVRSYMTSTNYGIPGAIEELALIQTNGYVARLGTYNAVLQAVIDSVSQKEILGKHLIQGTLTNRPLKDTAFIEFDGVDNWMRTGNNFGTLGTVYAYVQKIGTDEDFVMQNNLTGLGEFGSGYLRIGSNIAGSSFYNFRLKRMWIRTVTDDAGTIAKLNEWFSRQEVPLGVTPYGVYDNDAVFANQVVWNNGE